MLLSMASGYRITLQLRINAKQPSLEFEFASAITGTTA
jgi:hypothetical protein